MATAASPVEVLKPSAEKTNYIRLARLLMSGGTTVVRGVFDSIIPPSQLPAKLNEPAVVSKLQQMRHKKILTFPQWNVLFSSSTTYGKSESFDITLLFKLLREFCRLPAPPKGWDDLPDDKGHSLSADLASIKYYRNELCHANEGISDDDFNTSGKRIKGALLRMVQTLPSLGTSKDWENEIDKLLTGPVTEDDERNIEELKSWYLQDMEIKGMLNKIIMKQNMELKAMLQQLPDVIVNRLREEKIMSQSKDRNVYGTSGMNREMMGLDINTDNSWSEAHYDPESINPMFDSLPIGADGVFGPVKSYEAAGGGHVDVSFPINPYEVLGVSSTDSLPIGADGVFGPVKSISYEAAGGGHVDVSFPINPYEVLGVSSTASISDISIAFEDKINQLSRQNRAMVSIAYYILTSSADRCKREKDSFSIRVLDHFVLAAAGDTKALASRIDRKNILNEVDEDKRTLLYLACRSGLYDTTKLLLTKGASINKTQIDGSTPLHAAAYYGHKLVVGLLLEHGAATDIKNRWGYTALDESRTDEIKSLYMDYT